MHPETRRLLIRLIASMTLAWAVALAVCFGFYFGLSALLRRSGHDHPPMTIPQLLHRLPSIGAHPNAP